MEITKDIFEKLLSLSGLPKRAGSKYYILSDQKIHTFQLGADGSIWNLTMGSNKDTYETIKDITARKTFIGEYQQLSKTKP